MLEFTEIAPGVRIARHVDEGDQPEGVVPVRVREHDADHAVAGRLDGVAQFGTALG